MENTTKFCAINTSKGYKWPTLSELYEKIFNTPLTGTHNAVIDIEATAKCFWFLKINKIINFETNIDQPQINAELIKPTVVKPSVIKHINNNTMNQKEYAINLKGFLESLMLCDEVSQKQLEILYQKMEDLIISLENQNEDNDYDDNDDYLTNTIPNVHQSPRGNFNEPAPVDDLPF